jgi:hypothetical protein
VVLLRLRLRLLSFLRGRLVYCLSYSSEVGLYTAAPTRLTIAPAIALTSAPPSFERPGPLYVSRASRLGVLQHSVPFLSVPSAVHRAPRDESPPRLRRSLIRRRGGRVLYTRLGVLQHLPFFPFPHVEHPFFRLPTAPRVRRHVLTPFDTSTFFFHFISRGLLDQARSCIREAASSAPCTFAISASTSPLRRTHHAPPLRHLTHLGSLTTAVIKR